MIGAIEFLEKLYLCVFNNKIVIRSYLENEILAPMCVTVQEQILGVTVKNELCKNYPPHPSFKKMFLRTLIDTVDKYGEEHSEELLEAYTKTLSISSEQNTGYHSYIINKECIITLQENNCFVANSTTGLQTWEASKYLSEWCICNHVKLKNKTILELGSGVGLLGVAVLKLCQPKRYIFTDKSWDVLNALSSNLKINIPDLQNYDIQQIQLVWSTTSESDATNLSSDILLGADLVYDKSMVESLVHALNSFLSTNASCAYITSTIRDPDTDKKFQFHLDLSGLTYEILDPHEKSMFIYNPSSSFVLYKINKKY